MAQKDKIGYGSGQVFVVDYVKEEFPDVEDVSKITEEQMTAVLTYVADRAIEANKIGALKDGYSFTSETEEFHDESDLGEYTVDDVTKSNGKVAFGLFNVNTETIAKNFAYSRHGTAKGAKITTAGGLTPNGKTVKVYIFLKTNKDTGDTVCITVGKNVSGFERAFKPGAVTPFAVNAKCQPINALGDYYIELDAPDTSDFKWADYKTK